MLKTRSERFERDSPLEQPAAAAATTTNEKWVVDVALNNPLVRSPISVIIIIHVIVGVGLGIADAGTRMATGVALAMNCCMGLLIESDCCWSAVSDSYAAAGVVDGVLVVVVGAGGVVAAAAAAVDGVAVAD